MRIYASSFVLGELEHPNRMPFSGVLTWLNAASDEAPNGSNGLPVYISASVGVPALPSLVGMAVNYSDSANRHAPQSKIGVIEAASIGEADENGAIPVIISGYIYASDFEDAAIAIKLNQANLGFSYETTQTQISASVIGGRKVANVDALGFFTGASILFKQSAAYHNTSLAASLVNGGDTLDNTEIIAAIVALREYIDSKFTLLQEQQWRDQTVEFAQDYVEQAAVAVDEATETLDEIIVEVVVDELVSGNDIIVINASTDEPAADIVDAVDALDDAPVENAPVDIDASAEIAAETVEVVVDPALTALQAQLDEAMATITALNAAAPQRKSVSALDTLASKFDISASSDKTSVFASIDARTDLSVEDRLALKLEARRAAN
jgi:uncharacterized protein YqgV (UPF0045/DUF77 family)